MPHFQNPKQPRIDSRIVWTLIGAAVVYRLVATQFPSLSNTSPTMALCFGGGLLLGRKFWWTPAVLILASDFLIGFFRGFPGVGAYTVLTICFFCGVAFLGSWLGKKSAAGKTWPVLWGGVLLSSVLFYVVANTFAWAAYPGYAKTLTGWWQSQTIGLPEFSPPAWVFLRNAIIGDTIWCSLAGLVFLAKKEGETIRDTEAEAVSQQGSTG